jgi:hypothetical protein
MSLWIDVSVGRRDNRKLVASVHAWNISDLADVSDYEYIAEEFGNKHLGIEPSEMAGKVEAHHRRQSVWSLVGKIMDQVR